MFARIEMSVRVLLMGCGNPKGMRPQRRKRISNTGWRVVEYIE